MDMIQKGSTKKNKITYAARNRQYIRNRCTQDRLKKFRLFSTWLFVAILRVVQLYSWHEVLGPRCPLLQKTVWSPQ